MQCSARNSRRLLPFVWSSDYDKVLLEYVTENIILEKADWVWKLLQVSSVSSDIAYMFVVDIKKILKKKLYYQEEFNTSQVVFNYVSHLHIFRYCWKILYFPTFLELWNGGEDEHADGGEQEQRRHNHQNLSMLTFLSLLQPKLWTYLSSFRRIWVFEHVPDLLPDSGAVQPGERVVLLT